MSALFLAEVGGVSKRDLVFFLGSLLIFTELRDKLFSALIAFARFTLEVTINNVAGTIRQMKTGCVVMVFTASAQCVSDGDGVDFINRKRQKV